MKFFLDFDYVVFNTGNFNSDRIKIFDGHGIKKEVFIQYFEEFKKRRRKGEPVTYSQKRHIETLENALSGFDFEKPKNDLAKFMENLEKYVVKEFYDFAKRAGKENLYLISYGDIEFQTEKIKNSGVEKYFNEVIITEGLKSKALIEKFGNSNAEILMGGNTYFIDDRVGNLEDVKKEIPAIKTLLMFAEEGKHGDERENEFCDGVIESFSELDGLLAEHNKITKK